MKLRNRIIKPITLTFLTVLLLIFIMKQVLGYSPIGHLYIGYYNFFNSNEIIENEYRVKIPFFSWRIEKETSNSIVLYGIKTKEDFLKVSFDKQFTNKSLSEIEKMCMSENNISTIKINDFFATSIYCENKNADKLKPYRIVFIKNKLFIFMYDYQINYQAQYTKLISNIQLKNSPRSHSSPMGVHTEVR